MRLLILTQKIDKNDDVLGFFVRWVEEFRKKVEYVSVICLEKGDHDIPVSTPVFSLGKEKRPSKIQYLFRFYRYIFSEINRYDTVFVHMNQEYVLLGALIWRIFGKKIYFWRNHPNGSIWTRLAVGLSHRVFCTSEFSFTAQFRKTEIMPAGIDTDYFVDTENPARHVSPLLYLGRISSIKKVDILIDALHMLRDRGRTCATDIYGTAVNRVLEKEYYMKLREHATSLEKSGTIAFRGAVSHHDTPTIYNAHGILINLTPTGSFDKVILEMMACGGLVLVSNKSYKEIFPLEWHNILIFKEGDARDLADKIQGLLLLSIEKKREIGVYSRKIVCQKHSLALLVDKIISPCDR